MTPNRTWRFLDRLAGRRPTTLDETVRRDLARLLDERVPLTFAELERRVAGSVLEFGLPEDGAFSQGQGRSREQLAQLLARRISAYEPTLRGVEIEFVERPGARFELVIRAQLVVGSGPPRPFMAQLWR